MILHVHIGNNLRSGQAKVMSVFLPQYGIDHMKATSVPRSIGSRARPPHRPHRRPRIPSSIFYPSPSLPAAAGREQVSESANAGRCVAGRGEELSHCVSVLPSSPRTEINYISRKKRNLVGADSSWQSVLICMRGRSFPVKFFASKSSEGTIAVGVEVLGTKKSLPLPLSSLD